MDFNNFKPCLLIAMPELADPNFARAVVLLTDYNKSGASGFIINRHTDMLLGKCLVLPKGQLNPDYALIKLWTGGPVEPEKIWILYDRRSHFNEADTHLGEGIMVAKSIEILTHSEFTIDANHMRVYHGYSGWGAAQLDAELAASFWITAPLTPEIIFDTPLDEIWHKAIKKLGIDADKLVSPTSRFVN